MNPSQNPSALRSKKIITETLLDLMKQYPFDEITVKRILLETKISRKTFYRNFTSKDDVLGSYIDEILMDYKKALVQMGRVSMLDTFDVIFKFCEDYRELLIMLRNNHLLHIPLMKLNAFLPLFYDDLGQKIYIIYFNIGAVWNVITQWLENDMTDFPETMKRLLIDYLIDINEVNFCQNLKQSQLIP